MKIGIPYGTTALGFVFLLWMEKSQPHAIQKCLNGRNFFFHSCILFTLLTKSTYFFFLVLQIRCSCVSPPRCLQCELFLLLLLFGKQVAYSLGRCFCVDNFPIRIHNKQASKHKKVSVFAWMYDSRTEIYVSREFFGLDSIQTICVPMYTPQTHTHSRVKRISNMYAWHSYPQWGGKNKPSTGRKKDDRFDIGHTYQKPSEIIKWNTLLSFASGAIHFAITLSVAHFLRGPSLPPRYIDNSFLGLSPFFNFMPHWLRLASVTCD